MAARRNNPPAPLSRGGRRRRRLRQMALRPRRPRQLDIPGTPAPLPRLARPRAAAAPPAPAPLPQVGRQLAHPIVARPGRMVWDKVTRTWVDRPRPRSLGIAALSETERRRAGQLRRWSLPVLRPQTRGDCEAGPRPCPWVSCRYHLFLDITSHDAPKVNFPDLMPWDMPETCALDIAERGGMSLDLVGEFMNITMERARQYERVASDKIKDAVDGGAVPAFRRDDEEGDDE